MTPLFFLAPLLVAGAVAVGQLLVLASVPRAARQGRAARTTRWKVVSGLGVSGCILLLLRGSATTGLTQALWLVLLLVVAALAAAAVLCWPHLPARGRKRLTTGAPSSDGAPDAS